MNLPPSAKLGIIVDTSEAGAHVWMKKGLCRDLDPELFFPSDGAGVIKAKKVCKKCKVVENCLEYALANRVDHGVWGGASERERRRILKKRKTEVAEVLTVVSNSDDY